MDSKQKKQLKNDYLDNKFTTPKSYEDIKKETETQSSDFVDYMTKSESEKKK
jgi:hypothetical protein